MREFFTGWRKKIGAVTLVMALMIVAVWIRSFRSTDIVNLHSIPNTSLMFISERSGIVFLWMNNEAPQFTDGRLDDSYVLLGQNLRLNQIMPRELQPEWKFEWLGFQYGNARDVKGAAAWVADIHEVFGSTVKASDFKGLIASVLVIPHWSVVMPLTLLSAYLLLSKPRIATSKTVADFITSEET